MPFRSSRPRVGSWNRADEIGHRRLPGPAAADERDDRAAGHLQVEVAHDRPALAVLEVDRFELDRLDHGWGRPCVGLVRLVALHPEHLEDALHRRERALQLREGVDDVPHRIQQEERVPLERHDVADRRASRHVQEPAVPDDHDVDDADEQPPEHPEDELPPVGEEILPQDRVPAQHVLQQLARLAPEGTDHPDARERLAHAAVDLLDVLARRRDKSAARASRTRSSSPSRPG